MNKHIEGNLRSDIVMKLKDAKKSYKIKEKKIDILSNRGIVEAENQP